MIKVLINLNTIDVLFFSFIQFRSVYIGCYVMPNIIDHFFSILSMKNNPIHYIHWTCVHSIDPNRPYYIYYYQTPFSNAPTTFANNRRFLDFLPFIVFISICFANYTILYSTLSPYIPEPSLSSNIFNSPNRIWCLFVCQVFAYFSVRSLSYSLLFTGEHRPGHTTLRLCLMPLAFRIIIIVDRRRYFASTYLRIYAILLTHFSAWEVETHAEPKWTAPRPIFSIQSI